MAKVAELLVEIGAKTDKLNKGLKDAEKKVEGFGDSVKRIGAIVGVAFGVREVINFGKEALRIAGIAEGVRAAFNRLDQPTLLDDLKKATRGTIDEITLMQQAVRAENFKVPLEKLATFFEFATKRAAQTGESVDYLVSSIIDGIGRKSTLVMDNLGISAAELQKEIKKTGDFGLAAGEIIQRELAKAGDVALTSAQKIDQMAASSVDLKIKIGELIIKSDTFTETLSTLNILLDSIKTGLDELKTSSEDLKEPLAKINSIFKEIATSLAVPIIGVLKLTNKEIDLLNKLFERTDQIMPDSLTSNKPWLPGLPTTNEELKKFKRYFIDSTSAIKDSSEALNDWGQELTDSILKPAPGWGSITKELGYGLSKMKTESDLLRESLQYTFEDVLTSALMRADEGIKGFFDSIYQSLKAFLAKQIGIKIASALINMIFPGGGTVLGKGAGLGIPGLQHGGIVTQPTLAAIGERGPEAVIPLSGKNLNIKVEGRIRNKYIYLANKEYEYELGRVT